jgi:hypothetical protein
MAEIDRNALLQRLLAVEPGTLRRDVSGRESCIAIRRSWLYSFNNEIACAIGSGLDRDIVAVVPAQPLLTLLKTLNDKQIDIALDGQILVIRGKGKRTRMGIETAFPPRIDKVERPGTWLSLPKGFAEAIKLVARCTKKKVDPKEFAKACIHITPGWLEASDNVHCARFVLPNFVKDPILVRATSLLEITQLGFTQACETKYWVHFRNPAGLRMSIRKFEPESYPDLSRYLDMRGRRLTLPQGIKDAAGRAGIFANIGLDGLAVNVRIGPDGMVIEGKNGASEHREERAIGSFSGEPIAFSVPVKMLQELAGQANAVIEVSKATLRMVSGTYTYLSSITPI